MKQQSWREKLRRTIYEVLQLDNHGVPETQVQAALDDTQLRYLPFLCTGVGILFLAYGLIQAVVLQENGRWVMVLTAVVSTVILWGVWVWARQGKIQPAHVERWMAFGAGLVLVSVLLRAQLTQDPKQAANLALFLFGIATLFMRPFWYGFMSLVTFAGLLLMIWTFPPSDDWPYYVVVTLAAMATGLLAHVVRVRAYRHTVVLRIVEKRQRQEIARLFTEVNALNKHLEQRVAVRTEELAAINTRLALLDKHKTDFITIASHELRTPLTIVNFYSQMFMEDPFILASPTHGKWADGIYRGVMRMEDVVENMLDVAKIDSHTLEMFPSVLNVRFLIQQVVSRLLREMGERQVIIEVAPMPDVPELEADAEALQKLFGHVLLNAVKYTPDGGRVTVTGRLLPDTAVPHTEFVITDTGIGIDPHVQELIFEKFYQPGEVMLHSSGKMSFKGGGSGIGLAIARGIVVLHHGRIWAESTGRNEQTNPGSRIHIVLPVRQPVLEM
jgi:signal transduction histidine kinase